MKTILSFLLLLSTLCVSDSNLNLGVGAGHQYVPLMEISSEPGIDLTVKYKSSNLFLSAKGIYIEKTHDKEMDYRLGYKLSNVLLITGLNDLIDNTTIKLVGGKYKNSDYTVNIVYGKPEKAKKGYFAQIEHNLDKTTVFGVKVGKEMFTNTDYTELHLTNAHKITIYGIQITGKASYKTRGKQDGLNMTLHLEKKF